MTYAQPGALQKHGALGNNAEYGAWKITIVPPKAKQAITKVVVAASLKEIVNTYNDVIAAEFLGEGGVVVTLAISQNDEGVLAVSPSPGVEA